MPKDKNKKLCNQIVEPDILFILDNKWRISYCSAPALSLLGKSPRDIIGKECQHIFRATLGDDLVKKTCDLKDRIVSGRAICDFRVSVSPSDGGQNSIFFLTIIPFFDADATFTGSALVLRSTSKESSTANLILDSVADGVFTVNGEWRITSFNKAAETITGWRKGEAYGRPCKEIFQSSVCGSECLLAKSINNGEPVINKAIFIKKADGSSVPISISASPLLDHEGNIIGGVETFRDITATIERDLILDSVADGVFTVDRHSRITSFNKAAETITGYKAKDAIGKTCHEIFRSNICQTSCAIAKSMKSRAPASKELVFIKRADGKSVPISVSAAPLMDNEGNIIGGVEIFRDQTRAVEQELIFNSIADGVFTVDRHSRITSFNKAAETITGYKAKDAIGKTCHEIFRSNICGTSCAIAKSMKSGLPVSNRSVTIERSDGKKVPISVSAAPLMDNEGNIIGGVETFRDLSVLTNLRKQLSQRYTFGDIISKSPMMQRIFSIMPDIARSDSNVLILGESGTGKELIARAIHSLSNRRNGPFVAVNCGALPDTLLESELFGHKAGAFTDAKKDRPGRFAAAEGGTIFLDEIGDISQALQVKLLRVLQNKVYEPLGSNKPVKANVRILAATNRDLPDLVSKGEFREDLFYRLNVVKIQLPALRDRIEDIPLLVDHFIQKFNAEKGKEIAGISNKALDLLMRYNFPGNIRELENIIEYAFILCHGGLIEPEHLPEPFGLEATEKGQSAQLSLDRPMSLEEIEKRAIIKALERNRWRKLATCRELGISKDTLRRKIKRYGIERTT